MAQITPYPSDDVQITSLLRQYDAVVVHGPWHGAAPDCASLGCVVVQERIALRGRHKPGEITADALHSPEDVLFWHEYLLRSKQP